MEGFETIAWPRLWYASINCLIPYFSLIRSFFSDVTDLAFSPGDRYLASTGLDSKVLIWNGSNLELLRKLDQHQGFVKGVCWDPVGQYLATQVRTSICSPILILILFRSPTINPSKYGIRPIGPWKRP